MYRLVVFQKKKYYIFFLISHWVLFELFSCHGSHLLFLININYLKEFKGLYAKLCQELADIFNFTSTSKTHIWGFMVVVFNATFNHISLISWQSVLLEEETRVHRENH